jgi:hypothetical protein
MLPGSERHGLITAVSNVELMRGVTFGKWLLVAVERGKPHVIFISSKWAR